MPSMHSRKYQVLPFSPAPFETVHALLTTASLHGRQEGGWHADGCGVYSFSRVLGNAPGNPPPFSTRFN